MQKKNPQDKYKEATVITGRQGEQRAVLFLEQNGYTVIERNFRYRGGEIDIIAEKNDYLVFAEVKAIPKSNYEMLGNELNLRKQQKIIKTAKLYLEKYRQYSNRLIRFDVLVIDGPYLDPVHHIENAFSE